MTRELAALVDGQEIGRIRRDTSGRLKFIYAESWRRSDVSYPLSLSMPLAAAEHSHAVIDAFLWGLLPDNEQILDRWAKKFQVSARSAFALIAHVGEDCAGAVQFVLPEREEAYRNASRDKIEWLKEAQIAARLRALRNDISAWRAPSDTGQFSLAGAQAKTALQFDGKRWGVPSGRTPTTHILKPPSGEFDGHAENEHFCLTLARALGLPAASSQVLRFEDEIAIVVERYDRVRAGKRLVRVHQEDMCQALGVPPIKKYENEGGPSARAIVELLRAQSSAAMDDIASFIDAIAFNWLIAGTDGHAKNYSILIGADGKNRLAPLYDLASTLPYKKLDSHKLKLAMKIGGEYQLQNIGLRNWQRFAKEARLEEDALAKRVRDIAARLPDEASAANIRLQKEGLAHPILSRLADSIAARSHKCETALNKIAATKLDRPTMPGSPTRGRT